MQLPRGTFLLVALILSGLAVLYGREFALDRDEPPAFFMEKRQGIAVYLGSGFPVAGVHQFSDGTTPQSVILMAERMSALNKLANPHLMHPLVNGEALDILWNSEESVEVKRYWMPASQRMALGIPLHPDRMSCEDWEALHGIGPRLAQTIEEDRQRNGDFGSLERLQRVKGIGPKRLVAWKKFFQSVD